METVVRILHWIVTIGLILVVLLQPSRSAGLSFMGAGFEGMSSRRKKGLEAMFSKADCGICSGFHGYLAGACISQALKSPAGGLHGQSDAECYVIFC